MAILKYKKLRDGAQAPVRKTEGAFCFDLICPDDFELIGGMLGQIVPLGLAVEVPGGNALMIALRSSTGAKTNIRLANGIGIIDSDYRGEIGLILDNIGVSKTIIKAGDRIGQCYLANGTIDAFVEVDELSDTERGTGGFGSTGR